MKNIKKYSVLLIIVAALTCCTHSFGMDIFKTTGINDIEDDQFVNLVDNFGNTPLSKACIIKNLKEVKLLLDKGADANKTVKDGWTPLLWACSNNELDIVKLLLDNGAQESVNIANIIGWTPLYLACRNNNLDMVKLLLDKGADVNKAYKRWTPLCNACSNNKILIVKLLLKYGANVDDKSIERAKNKTEILELLMAAKGLEKEKEKMPIIKPNFDKCGICGDKFEDVLLVKLNCNEGHLFHRNCIEWWHLVRQTCPICECPAKIQNTLIENKNVNLEKKVYLEKSIKKDEIDIKDIEVKM